MAKLPLEIDPAASDPPWTRMATVGEYLDAGEPVPPFLARWLSEAIANAGGDPDRLIAALGIRKPQGRPSAWDDPEAKAAMVRLWGLVDDGEPVERAIDTVRDEFMTRDGEERFSRSTLQRWLSSARQAENEKWGD